MFLGPLKQIALKGYWAIVWSSPVKVDGLVTFMGNYAKSISQQSVPGWCQVMSSQKAVIFDRFPVISMMFKVSNFFLGRWRIINLTWIQCPWCMSTLFWYIETINLCEAWCDLLRPHPNRMVIEDQGIHQKIHNFLDSTDTWSTKSCKSQDAPHLKNATNSSLQLVHDVWRRSSCRHKHNIQCIY